MEQYQTLRPVREPTSDYDEIEQRIKLAFKHRIYEPLLYLLNAPREALENAKFSALQEALEAGRVTFLRGTFSGRFNASISRELKRLGATWDKRSRTFSLRLE